MNLWEKLKLLWKGRAIATDLIDVKSRWKEPTFWAALLSNAIAFVGVLKGPLSPSVVVIVNAVLSAAYNYVRGIQKAQSDGVAPFKSSTEFWIGIAAMVNTALIAVQTGGVSAPAMITASVVITHAIAAARDMANMRPAEAVAVAKS